MKTLIKNVAVAAAFLAASGGAQATVITSASNNPLNFSWSFDTGSALLTGFGSMTLSGFNSSSLTIATSLTNTSLPGQGGDRLTSFGIGINPDATGVSFSDANDNGLVDAVLNTGGNTSIPSLHDVIEVCAYGGNNCSGGSNGGIFGGASDSFSIILAGTWGSSVDIDPIGFKYQTGNGSFEFTTSSSTSSSSTSSGTTSTSSGTTSTSSGTTSTSSGTTSTSSGTTSTSSGTVAEPGTSSMALLALGLMGFALRNSRGVKQS